MKQINFLFIGDLTFLRTNYGAVATTESLKKIVRGQLPNANIKYIDYRSIWSPTPPNGWPDNKGIENQVSRKERLKRVFRKYIPYRILLIRRILTISQYKTGPRVDIVPYKFLQYEEFYSKMINGEILQYEKQLLDWAEIIFINGEGTIVDGTDEWGKYRKDALYNLFMAWCSKMKYHKMTCIVNHTVDPNNSDAYEIISKLYPSLDVVLVRETLSLQNLNNIGVYNAKFVPDALFSFKPNKKWEPSDIIKSQIDFTKPYICLGDSSGFSGMNSHVSWNIESVLGELIEKLKEIVPQIIFIEGCGGVSLEICELVHTKKIGMIHAKNSTYHDLYEILKRSEIFVSGRWHASILSILSGTPIVLWGADSHKTRSLYKLLDYPFPFFEVNSLPIHLDDIAETVNCILSSKEEVKRNILSKVEQYKARTDENASFLKNMIIEA
jgi:polysaccharide pyruvyl transferase WcaK-like protein